MASIFSLYGEIFIDKEKAEKNLNDIKKKGAETSTSFAEKFGNIASSTIKVGTAVAGATATIVGGLSALAMNVADTAGSIDDSAMKVGMSAEEYQKWAYAAKLGGMEASKLESLMVKQQKAFSDAKEGSSSLSEAYKRLGVNLNEIGSSEAAFEAVIASLADMEDVTTRNALANDIFGKSYADLAPLLAEGSEGIAALRQEAVDLGGVMSNEAVSAGAGFGDLVDKLKTGLGGMVNQISAQLLPILQQFLQLILSNLPMIQGMIDQLAPILVSTLEVILPVFVQLCESLLPILVELIAQLLPPICEIIQQLLPIFVELLSILLPPIIQIIETLLPVLLPLLQAILPLLEPLLDLISWAITNVLNPVIKVITSIANVISKVLVVALNALKPVVEGIKTIFEKVFGGLFNIVKAPINFIIGGINTFISALNKIKIPDWVPAVGGKGINLPLIQKLRVGLEYVPYDEMPALLHKGETVLDKEEAEEYRRNKNVSHQNNVVYNNNITIENLEVRKESDIEDIAEELYYLQKKEVLV